MKTFPKNGYFESTIQLYIYTCSIRIIKQNKQVGAELSQAHGLAL